MHPSNGPGPGSGDAFSKRCSSGSFPLAKLYERCTFCPHCCGIDRTRVQQGVCRAPSALRVARAALHFWEEPVLSGTRGSGTVFFSHCPLSCVYCQNSSISADGCGTQITTERLAAIFLELQQLSAHNINLVTPTHYVPSIIEAVGTARREGLAIPIVYNSSGYESVETIRLLKGTVDIYLTDFKYFDDRLAIRYSSASRYSDFALEALEEMVAQAGIRSMLPNMTGHPRS